MVHRVRIDGIYDQRTLNHLKQTELRDFSFDFSPRSFNFIQEHVFLEQLVPLLTDNDRIFFHFNRSNDPMVTKLADDSRKAGVRPENIFFEFDEWSQEINTETFPHQYLLHYSGEQNVPKTLGPNFFGFTFEFSFLENLFHKNLLTRFSTNFYTRFGTRLNESHQLVLKMQWNSNIISSLFELFDFDLISWPIGPEIEVCYRNVDLKKLSNEMTMLKKYEMNDRDY